MKLHLSITDSQFSNINWIESLLSRIVLQYYEVYDFFYLLSEDTKAILKIYYSYQNID